MTRKKVLFMISQPPGLGAITHEVIDAVLVMGAFDQDVGVLFTGDGVFQLRPASTGAPGNARDHVKALQALATYDVTRIYADRSALEARSLAAAELALDAQVLTASEIASLIAQHDVVLSG